MAIQLFSIDFGASFYITTYLQGKMDREASIVTEYIRRLAIDSLQITREPRTVENEHNTIERIVETI